jgi:RNA polymerase sigma-70 factor (sigma-E family)
LPERIRTLPVTHGEVSAQVRPETSQDGTTSQADSAGSRLDRPPACKPIGKLLRLRGVADDQSEFTRFYETSRDACLRAVLASVGDRTLAEDMVAEAFARAWTSWRKVSQYAAPQGWVVRTALNTGVSWWRPRRRETPLSGYDAAAAEELGAGVDPAVVSALRRLPSRQREVIALRVFLDLDTNTTAEILGIAAGTVKAHLSRAVTALRRDPALRNAAAPTQARITAMEVTNE